ncbi:MULTISPECIES: Bor family protein [Pseudoalteromonas]|uniref:Bor family protein n=1 Tax=Pseudoalteromonas TaxID=53246 RepID=UPI00078276A1|nr:Bor family protein [Pseudoalteromonas arabiensis]
MKQLVCVLLTLSLVACSSVTIVPNKADKLTRNADYQDSRPFYLWGLVGEQRVDVKAVCQDKKVMQMQSLQTFTDGALGLVTLGIYAPHTVKVWCEQYGQEQL